ncbi:MAG: undecaprenyl-diphosphate phosphatase, partial [Isosphaeraceae bacterium]
MEWIESLILGVVQGITEFLPVSSDGHLAITQQAFAWLTGHSRSGQEDLFFDIMLHAGTLAAILFSFRSVIVEGARGLLRGDGSVRPGYDRASILRAAVLAMVATSPLVPFALFFKKRLEHMFQSSQAAGVGFLITGLVLLLVSRRLKGTEGAKGLAQTSWLDALLIGIAQMFAPLPGVSRSGLTIASALALGFSRTWSVGFSLLIAVPAICGAVVFELKDVVKDHHALGLTPDRISQTVAATVVAGIVGYFAIIWLIRVVR